MTMDKPRCKANALHQNVKNYAELRFHSFSDGEVIG